MSEPATAVEPTAIVEPLDTFLRDVVVALQTAVDRATRALATDPAAADRVIKDCEEILDTIMAGQVQEWIAG